MKMLIDGQWVAAADGKTQAVSNPGTGGAIDTVPVATAADVQRALQAAEQGGRRMRALPAHRRSAILAAAADVIHDRREELATLLARENGKPIRQTRDEVEVTARIFRGFAEEGRRIFGRTVPMDAVPGNERHFAMTVRQPLGVVAAIVPFNYPVELYAHKAAPALAAGNAVIAKPPSACPLTLLKIAGILEEAGLPRGAHQMVTGPGEQVGEMLARSPVVRMVSVTGSTAVGIRLAQLGAETLKKVHLELGGNDATIVCEDADLEKAAEAVDLEDAKKLEEKMRKGQFTLEDFLEQLRQMKKLGPLENIVGMLPGGSEMLKNADLSKQEKEFHHMEAMICGMTPQERRSPQILNAKRRQRIAKGSGVSVTELNTMLNKFAQMQQMMKKMGKFQKMMARMGGASAGLLGRKI